jgi:hypothetical protein
VSILFALVLRIGRRFWPAVFSAALWAVHPLGTEAVSNIVGRADLLAAGGVLGALYAYVRASASTGRERACWIAGVAAASTIAAFSKESGVTVVGVIVLYDVLWPNRRTIASRLLSWSAAAVPVALYLVQRNVVLSAVASLPVPFVDNPIAGASFWSARLTALTVAARYLGLLAWPARLSADYSFPQIPIASGSAGDWIAYATMAGLLLLAVWLFRVQRAGFFCIAAAAVTFLPVSNLLFSTGTIMAERLAYLPSAFVLPCVVIGVYALEQRTRLRVLAPAVLGLMIAALGIRTFARNQVWHDELTLWTATAQASPRSFKSHASLAEALYNADPARNNFARVIAEKERSLALLDGVPNPAALSKPFREAATYYLEYGDWLHTHPSTPDAVIAAYRRSAALSERYLALLDLEPASSTDRTEAELLLSTARERLHEGDKAAEAAGRALAGDPFNPMTYRTSAAALLSAQHADDAAVALMTGFMLTGNTELRGALIDLYRGGLDTRGCAVTSGPSGAVLNVSCAIVRRHLCAATIAASRTQRQAGRPDLAEQVEQSTRDSCANPTEATPAAR